MRGINLTIMVSPSNKTNEFEWVLQGDWKKAGINVTIDQKEYASTFDDCCRHLPAWSPWLDRRPSIMELPAAAHGLHRYDNTLPTTQRAGSTPS